MPHSLLHLVANERPLINLDATVLINLALFLFLLVVLRFLLWDPMVKLIAAREAGMEGSRDRAHALEAEARTKEAEYRDAQKRARADAAAAREKLRAEALTREAEIVAKARTATAQVLEQHRTELRARREALQKEIRATVPGLAADIASKVLGREVRS